MSGELVTDLYRELALHRVQEAIDKLRRAPTDRLMAQTAEVLEEAAGALACITAFYTSPGGTLERCWQEQINQLITVPNYFREESFAARLREAPGRPWRPVELVDHAAAHGTWHFPPGQGFEYSDTGYVICGILVEQVTGRPLHEVYRDYVFDPLGMDSTSLEGHEPTRRPEPAHHYSDDLDWTAISPTVDWAGGGLVTTAPDLARFVRGLWAERIVDAGGLEDLTRWTPGASFPPETGLRYDRYGLGMGCNVVDGVQLLGHTGFIGGLRIPRAQVRRGSRRHPQRLACRPLAARRCALPGAARGGLRARGLATHLTAVLTPFLWMPGDAPRQRPHKWLNPPFRPLPVSRRRGDRVRLRHAERPAIAMDDFQHSPP